MLESIPEAATSYKVILQSVLEGSTIFPIVQVAKVTLEGWETYKSFSEVE